MVAARFQWITFDCYGTLIDWEAGISDAFRVEAARDGRRVEAATILDAYHAIEPAIEKGPYRSYRDVLTATAARVAERLDWPLARQRTSFLAESLPSWPPFPDTNPALARLAAEGARLGILSNVDDDLLAGTRRHFTSSFDLLVTAQQVRSYKPGHAHFIRARDRIGDGVAWLHAARSYFHDVAPCKELGVPVAWINRKGEPAGSSGRPDQEFRDLAGLADWVLSPKS
jgi:2-haloacid dehalogenase/putative hydrolase of the HAD superfamily